MGDTRAGAVTGTLDGFAWGTRAASVAEVRIAEGAIAGDPVLSRFRIGSSPSALVIALTCRNCDSVVTIGRGRRGLSEVPAPLTLAELVHVAEGHVDQCPQAPTARKPESAGEQLVDQAAATG